MEAIAAQHSRIFLRKVDIGAWDSPVARQHGIRRLPTIWLYEDGRLYTKEPDRASRRLQELVDRQMNARRREE